MQLLICGTGPNIIQIGFAEPLTFQCLKIGEGDVQERMKSSTMSKQTHLQGSGATKRSIGKCAICLFGVTCIQEWRKGGNVFIYCPKGFANYLSLLNELRFV